MEINDLTQRLSSLPPRRRAELAARLKERGAEFGVFPLSFAQERLWFIDQLEPGSPLYNLPAALRVEGPLRLAALAQSLSEVVRRHEVLRTKFVALNGDPVQIVGPFTPLKLGVVDLGGLNERERETAIRRLLDAEAMRPFALTRDALLRATALRESERDHVLLLTMHHIVADGWSMELLVREALASYTAFASGAPVMLPSLPLQYADFAYWQRKHLQGPAFDTHLNYWKTRLAGASNVLELPTDRPRPPVQTFNGGKRALKLPSGLAARLAQIGRREGVTLFTTLLAAFQALLYRYTGQADLNVGTPSAGRGRREVSDLIGFFVNTLVIRARVDGSESFIQLMRRVGEEALEAQAHEDAPFEKIVEELQPARSLNHPPLFQVMFTLRNASRETFEIPGLRLRTLSPEREPAKFDLGLVIVEQSDGLHCALNYNTDIFDPSTAGRLLRCYATLLEGVAGDPARAVRDLPLLTDEERLRLAPEPEGASDSGATLPVHRLFETWAARTPDAVALIYEGRTYSFAELNRRANRLGRRLRSLGVGPEERVGLCAERSIELVAGLLAIFKSGGAHVPLDPTYPTERLSYMIADSGAAVLLTTGRLAGKLAGHGARLLLLDGEAGEDLSGDDGNTDGGAGPRDLAYVLYTSGTTGRPKAVMVEHGNLASTLAAAQREFEFRPDDVTPCIASFSFDISLFELLTPMLAGGAALLFTRELTLDLPRLIETLKGCTVLHTLPSLMRQIVGAVREADPTGEAYARMRMLFVGGDLVPPDLLDEMNAVFRSAETRVLYGPTEATIICSGFHAPRERAAEGHLIGRALANSTLRLLDSDGNLVPVGVVGEIHIGGPCVTRGYLNHAELTAEKYPVIDSRRYYRSGDLGRYRPDGQIEFLGRDDGQVKVRGYRVELGEVESALAEHESVRECAVVARAEGAGGKRLVAYVVYARTPAPGELRRFLSKRLPDYMTPSAFVALERLPLTTNGKVDRKALPAPDESRPELAPGYVAPHTPLEEIMAGLWEALLGAPRVGARDDFFDLGGHSLLAAQLVSRVRDAFGVELPLRALFESPTVGGLSEAVGRALGERAEPVAPPLKPVARDGRLPLSFAQQRLWFFDQLKPNSAIFNIHYGARLRGELNYAALGQCMDEIIRRHEVLRTSFPSIDGRPEQRIAPPRNLSIPVVDLQELSPAARARAAARLAGGEAMRPFDLAHGPMLRVALLRFDEGESHALFTMHHIASDGWSVGVLAREMATLYKAFASGGRSPLTELTTQYADYAAWQREWLRGPALETGLAYWRERLKHAPPLFELPGDRPRPARMSFRGRAHSLLLPATLAEELRAMARREGATPFMTLLAAFKLLLYSRTGREDILVGADIANRTRAEIEPLIGFFVNQLVLRTRVDGELNFTELLARVRETTLGAYAHQDLPFEEVVDALQPERSPSYAPLFQIKVTLQNAPRETLSIDGLELGPLPSALEVASKLDLTLLISDDVGGIRIFYEYNADLYDAVTIERLGRLYEALLEMCVKQPEMTAAEASEKLEEMERRERAADKRRRDEAKFRKLKGVRPRPVEADRPVSLVNFEALRAGETLPLVIRPALAEVDLVNWVRNHRALVEESLIRHGGVLFRGFRLDVDADFERFAEATGARLFKDNGEHPRKTISGNVYTPVFYPPERKILWHNENSFNHEWPAKIMFCCDQPAAEGGETPLADSRKVFAQIDPDVRKRFMRKGVMYVRSYGGGLGLTWQEVFRTTERAEVECRCRQQRMEFEWRADGSLRTRAVRPAAVRHRQAGEWCWFNQAQHWHVSCLDGTTRASLRALYEEADFPRNCYYGDGETIPDAVMSHVLSVYERLEVSFPWRRADILLVDNLLTAHARNRFAGERRLLVAMGDMLSYGGADAVATGVEIGKNDAE